MTHKVSNATLNKNVLYPSINTALVGLINGPVFGTHLLVTCVFCVLQYLVQYEDIATCLLECTYSCCLTAFVLYC